MNIAKTTECLANVLTDFTVNQIDAGDGQVIGVLIVQGSRGAVDRLMTLLKADGDYEIKRMKQSLAPQPFTVKKPGILPCGVDGPLRRPK